MGIDLRSFLFAFFLISAFLTLLSLVTWKYAQGRAKGALDCLVGYVLLTLAMGGLALRNLIPGFYSMFLANALMISGAFLQMRGAGKLASDRPLSTLPGLLLLGLGYAGFFYFGVVDPNLVARLYLYALIIIGFDLMAIWTLLFRPRPHMESHARTAAVFFALFTLLYLWRIVSIPFLHLGQDWLAGGLSEALYVSISTLILTGLAFVELQLVNGILFGELARASEGLEERNQKLNEEVTRRTQAEFLLTNMNREIVSTQREIMVTLSEVVESRSRETAHHVLRVGEYARILAQSAGLPEETVALIADAAPMHDIGKIAVPDAILNKTGPLSEAERRTVEAHTSIGYEILNKSERSLIRAAALIALEHHERWDGRGYPAGKGGESISLSGRIVGVCDVFDALAVKRAYKEAWEFPAILDFFRREKGRMFDPSLVDSLFLNLDRFLAVALRYRDSDPSAEGGSDPFHYVI